MAGRRPVLSEETAQKREGLSPLAYREPGPDEQYEPYIPTDQSPTELTWRTLLAGIVFGILFGAANAYLGLRSGLTISTSIPVAVLAVAFFKALGAAGVRTSILEANMAQTVGSASSSVASGVIFTLPALFLWQMAPSLLQMTLLALCGGLLGVLFMIPLRKLLIRGEHGRLPYPEGTACAEVLVASEAGGRQARPVFAGLFGGALMKALTDLVGIVPKDVHVDVPVLPKSRVGMEVSAALFGVGYILGPRISAIMVGGGLLSWLVIIPSIAGWGDARALPLYPETVKTIAEMGPSELWTRYVRYIGAGAVATGGLLTLIRSLPTMMESLRIGTRELRSQIERTGDDEAVPRTERDLPLRWVGWGAFGVFLLLAFVPTPFGTLPSPWVRPVAALLVVVLAFFFVTVSSRIVGLVGVTSNPTSGMTIASLLVTSTLFYLMGWTDAYGQAAALTVGCVVAIAASIAGDTSQDLKTGFLLGATPRRQQVGELVGVLTCAVFVCLTLIVLDQSYGFGTEELPAPQATLMKLVIEGVLGGTLRWTLVLIGVGLALVAEVFRIPSLPFAVGVYLPVGTMVPVFLGGLLRMWMERSAPSEEVADIRRERGVLIGSGLVGGTGLFGVVLAAVAYFSGGSFVFFPIEWGEGAGLLVGLAAMAIMVALFALGSREPRESA